MCTSITMPLNLINLENAHFDNLIGVFIIWQGNDKHNIIEIGKGFIKEKLALLKKDKSVQKYGPDLYVTWAFIPTDSLEGVEAYLYSRLNPRISHTIASAEKINVNIPQ